MDTRSVSSTPSLTASWWIVAGVLRYSARVGHIRIAPRAIETTGRGAGDVGDGNDTEPLATVGSGTNRQDTAPSRTTRDPSYWNRSWTG